MTKSKIEWTDRTWNPVTGCTKVSPGCANCYAESFAIRMKGRFGYPYDDPFKVTFHPERMDEPFRWKKPSKVFVCSMSDLFHEDVELERIEDIITVIKMCPQHIFQILTKRPERLLLMLDFVHKLPDNMWIGVSVENQQTADERIPILLQVPAAVRFVSCEPLLGAIHFSKTWRLLPDDCTEKLNWVIAGGESGPGARPMHPDWARSLRDQCQAACVPFFFKQWGEYINPQNIKGMDYQRFKSYFPFGPKDGQIMLKTGKKAAGRLLDGREWNEFPEENKI